MPIFKTKHMEFFLSKLGSNYEKEALAKYGKGYGVLSLGEKYEILTELLLRSKSKNRDNLSFGMFLYNNFPPPRSQWWLGVTKPSKSAPMYPLGLLFEPEYEQEVVYLFSVMHRELGSPYIVHTSDSYPDATVLDDEKQPKKIEFELKASGFMSHINESGLQVQLASFLSFSPLRHININGSRFFVLFAFILCFFRILPPSSVSIQHLWQAKGKYSIGR